MRKIGSYGPLMHKRQRTPIIDRMREAIELIGGEPLDGSGFENETPDPEFSGAVAVPFTMLRPRKQ